MSVLLMEGKSHIWQDRIVFQKSDKDLQIQNSEFATLTSVNKMNL
ncbi:putative conjugative transfer TraA domain protein [Orientia tsutsugamushi str. UT76]|nr:putative conjugative transfer TraA domain protein [Orientia tsutsugamushi str. UT76]